jgi:polyisoprenoid-binding protein YceI
MTWVLDTRETLLGFEVRSFGVPALRGRFDRFTVAIPAGGGLDLLVEAASLSTGNPHRDARLTGPGWLDAGRYPEIAFRTRGVEPLHDIENSLTRVGGDLTLRGATHEVNWEFELLDRASDAAGELGAEYVGRLELALRDWGLRSPIPLVHPTVTVTLSLTILAGDRLVGVQNGWQVAPTGLPRRR